MSTQAPPSDVTNANYSRPRKRGLITPSTHPTTKSTKPSDKKSSQTALRRRRAALIEAACLRSQYFNGQSIYPLPPLFGSSSGAGSSKKDSRVTLPEHPYGVLPYGNILNSTSGDRTRQQGLGTLRKLNDDMLLDVLRYLPSSILTLLLQSSRFLYCIIHSESTLWRDLLLRTKWNVDYTFELPPTPAISWKDVHQYNIIHKFHPSNTSAFKAHTPIKVSNVYSDTIYRPFLCYSYIPPSSMNDVSTVDSIDRNNLTYTRFVNDYEIPNKPLIIRNGSTDWPALNKWTDEDYLSDMCNSPNPASDKTTFTFRATSGGAPVSQQFKMGDYIKYAQTIGKFDESPLYLFERDIDRVPGLVDDYRAALQDSLPFFSPLLTELPEKVELKHQSDLFSLLGTHRRPDHKWLIIGPPRSGSAFHIDPNATNAWNAPLSGRKRWIFYPPGVTPPGIFVDDRSEEVIMPVSLGEWVLSFWNQHVAERTNPDVSRRPLECVVEPGEVLFVPHGWWHCVFNVDDHNNQVNMALTQNYVSTSNLSDVLKFLETRENQISGLRDRVTSGAIAPENLLQEFKAKLIEHGMSGVLDKALLDGGIGWGCDAWRDVDDAVVEEGVGKGVSILGMAKEDNAGGGGSGFSFSFGL